MKSHKLIIAALLSTAFALSASAVTVSFSAVNTNGLGDSLGNDLAIGNTVELGIWSGTLFSTLDSYDTVDSDFAATTTTGAFSSAGAFQATTDNINSTGLGIANSQLAIRWLQGDGGFGIAYSTLSSWQLLSGDGTGSDTGTNIIDMSDLTDGSGATLLGTAVIEVGSFGGTSTTFGGTPMFQAAPVPEPSAFALIAGCFGLAWVMVRRRA